MSRLSALVPVLWLIAAAAAAADAPVDAPVSGPAVFAARCAVCHGPAAAGIPGSFPPLREQVVSFAATPAGREYLVMVVTTGLIGEVKVGGISYRGAMPAQSLLTEAEVAAVLSYLGSDRGRLGDAPTLTAADVAQIRAKHPQRDSQSTRQLRPATLDP